MPKLTPALPDIIRMGIEQRLETLHTHMPGQITKWSQKTGKANVQPLLMVQYKNQAQPTPLPVIPNVPVEFPSSGTAYLKLPLAVGDLVTLHFAERSMDAWLQSGGQAAPGSFGKFPLKDAVATPGVRPFNNPLSYKGNDTDLELGNGPGYWTIKKSGGFAFTLGSNELLATLLSLVNTLSSATVLNPTSGPQPFSPSVVSALAQVQTQLQALQG